MSLRIGTWNILSGSPVTPDATDTLAEAVARLDLDVLGLNEVDALQERSQLAHQTAVAAAAMGAVDWRFGPSYAGPPHQRRATPRRLFGPSDDIVGPHYGIALLSRIPVLRWQRLDLGASPVGLPLLYARNGRRAMRYVRDEPHLAIAAHLANGWTVVATHLSFVTPVGVAQLMRVRRWARRFGPQVAVLGDMNITRALIPLRPHWWSVGDVNTYPSWRPVVQFDHILLPRTRSATPLTLPSVGISDHLPIAAQVH